MSTRLTGTSLAFETGDAEMTLLRLAEVENDRKLASVQSQGSDAKVRSVE